jgi:hypothetical protein
VRALELFWEERTEVRLAKSQEKHFDNVCFKLIMTNFAIFH